MKITNYIPVILCSIALCGCSDAAKTVGFGTDSDAIEAPATGGTHTVRVSAEKSGSPPPTNRGSPSRPPTAAARPNAAYSSTRP